MYVSMYIYICICICICIYIYIYIQTTIYVYMHTRYEGEDQADLRRRDEGALHHEGHRRLRHELSMSIME